MKNNFSTHTSAWTHTYPAAHSCVARVWDRVCFCSIATPACEYSIVLRVCGKPKSPKIRDSNAWNTGVVCVRHRYFTCEICVVILDFLLTCYVFCYFYAFFLSCVCTEKQKQSKRILCVIASTADNIPFLPFPRAVSVTCCPGWDRQSNRFWHEG